MTDKQLTRTAGQMDVGGRICSRNSPRSHSGLTWDAHRLCSFNTHIHTQQCQWTSHIVLWSDHTQSSVIRPHRELHH